MVGIINELEENVLNKLNTLLTEQKQSTLVEIFTEDSAISKERITVLNNIAKIEKVLSMVMNYDV